jgi:hypothetical protein
MTQVRPVCHYFLLCPTPASHSGFTHDPLARFTRQHARHVGAKGKGGMNLVVDGALFGVAAQASCNGLATWLLKSAA